MVKKPLVSIIIVNWNGGDVFRDCLKSLKQVTYSNYEIIIVDNGSTDGTQKLARIMNKENYGFAKANNQGFEVAKGEYILLLNNDTKVEKDFLDKLINRIERDSKIGAIQPKIYLMDNTSRLDTVGSYLTKTGFLQHWGYLANDSGEFEKEKFIFSAKGACVLIRWKVIEKVGLFDDLFGSYFEDTDFSWKVWLIGYKILFYPNSKIYHKVGFTSKRQSQIFVNYHSFKNRIATLFKNLSLRNLITIGGVHVIALLFLSLYYLITLRVENAKIIVRAIYWNIKNFMVLLSERNKIQELRTKTDKEIFKFILRPIEFKEMFLHFVRSEKMFAGEHEV